MKRLCLVTHAQVTTKEAQRDMEDHHVLETTHSVQSWERLEIVCGGGGGGCAK